MNTPRPKKKPSVVNAWLRL